MQADVVIVGAGPAGLCLARALSGVGLNIVVLERQAESSLLNPAFDGREIALTHPSVRFMQELGLWDHIDPQAVSPLRDAKILNGVSLFSLDIGHRDARQN